VNNIDRNNHHLRYNINSTNVVCTSGQMQRSPARDTSVKTLHHIYYLASIIIFHSCSTYLSISHDMFVHVCANVFRSDTSLSTQPYRVLPLQWPSWSVPPGHTRNCLIGQNTLSIANRRFTYLDTSVQTFVDSIDDDTRSSMRYVVYVRKYCITARKP
jgi:hypothetical protein